MPLFVPISGNILEVPESVPGMTERPDLDAVLIGMVGRRLTVGQIIKALGMSTTTYYEQRAEGRLISPENLIRAAPNLGINALELLVRYGFIDAATIEQYVELYGPHPFRAEGDDGATPPLDATPPLEMVRPLPTQGDGPTSPKKTKKSAITQADPGGHSGASQRFRAVGFHL